jgi:predicted acetyltransferase
MTGLLRPGFQHNLGGQMSDIRAISADQMDEFVFLQADAYPGMKLVAADDRKRYKEILVRQSEDPRIAHYGLFREGRLLGGMTLFDFTMNVLGHKVPAGGVGSVAVNLLHKKEHIAKELMEFYFDHYDRKQAPLLVLWPFRSDFYRKMGFGLGAQSSQYRIRPKDLPRGSSREHVRYLAEADIPALNDFYNRCVDRTSGMIEEREEHWRLLAEFRPALRNVGYVKDGIVQGYLTFSFVPGQSGSFLENSISVVECLYDHREALSEMMSFLHTQFDQITHVTFTTHDDSFYFVPTDPRNGTNHLWRPVFQESNVAGTGVMYRVLDVERVFGVLKEHDFNGRTIRLKLNIRDTFFPRNNTGWTVAFTDGRPTLVSPGRCDAEITMDVAEFSSMLMGAVSFRKLYDYHLADISDETFVDAVNRLFHREDKPICLTPF